MASKKKNEKDHRDRKNPHAYEQWLKRKQVRNAMQRKAKEETLLLNALNKSHQTVKGRA